MNYNNSRLNAMIRGGNGNRTTTAKCSTPTTSRRIAT